MVNPMPLWVSVEYPQGYEFDVAALRDMLATRCGLDVRISQPRGGKRMDFEIVVADQPMFCEVHIGLVARSDRAKVFLALLGTDGFREMICLSGVVPRAA